MTESSSPLASLISSMKQCDESLRKHPLDNLTDESVIQLYEDVASIREISGLLWRPVFLLMCQRKLFDKPNDGGDVA